MRKKTTSRKVVKKGSYKTKKTSSKSEVSKKRTTLPKLKKTSIPQLPTPPPMIRVSRSSGEVNKPLIIGIISVVVLVIVFLIAQGTFVGKAVFANNEGSAGFVVIEDLPYNTDGLDSLQTEINEYWDQDNYLILGANIPQDKESVGVEVEINLGTLELKNMNFADDECNNAVEFRLTGDADWEFTKCTYDDVTNELKIEVATLDWQNAVSGEFDVAKLYLKEEPETDPNSYNVYVKSFEVLDLEPAHGNLITNILQDIDEPLIVTFKNNPDSGGELNWYEDDCPYDLQNACNQQDIQDDGGQDDDPPNCEAPQIEFEGVCVADDPVIIVVKDANNNLLVGNPVANQEYTVTVQVKPLVNLPANHKVIITVSQDGDQKTIFTNTKPGLNGGAIESFEFTYTPETAVPMSVETLVWNGYPAIGFQHSSYESKTQAYGN